MTGPPIDVATSPAGAEPSLEPTVPQDFLALFCFQSRGMSFRMTDEQVLASWLLFHEQILNNPEDVLTVLKMTLYHLVHLSRPNRASLRPIRMVVETSWCRGIHATLHPVVNFVGGDTELDIDVVIQYPDSRRPAT